MSHAGVLLDRDGVINRRRPTLVRHPRLLEILPGIPEAIARLTDAGYRIAVVTNQRPVAWGIIDRKDLDAIHEAIDEAVSAAGGRIERFDACTHGFFEDCSCGKPEPGMLEEAARALDLAPERSWMVGDKPSDVEAGERFGARTVWIHGSRYPWELLKKRPDADLEARDLPAAVDAILEADGRSA